MSETYTYDISEFTGLVPPYTVPAPDRLTNEVQESVTSVALLGITVNPVGNPGKTLFTFESALSSPQEALLGAVVTAHSGEPLPEPAPDPLSHDALRAVTEDQHHPRLHASEHAAGQEDALTLTPAQVGADQAEFNASKLQGRTVDAQAPTADQVLTWDDSDGWVPKPAQGGGGLPESHYVESEGNSSTTSSDLQKKVALTEEFDGGVYAVHWYCEVWASSLYRHTKVQVLVDDEVVAWTDLVMNGRYNENPNGGVKQVKLGAGEHTIVIAFARVEYCTAYIRRARIFAKKVGE